MPGVTPEVHLSVYRGIRLAEPAGWMAWGQAARAESRSHRRRPAHQVAGGRGLVSALPQARAGNDRAVTRGAPQRPAERARPDDRSAEHPGLLRPPHPAVDHSAGMRSQPPRPRRCTYAASCGPRPGSRTFRSATVREDGGRWQSRTFGRSRHDRDTATLVRGPLALAYAPMFETSEDRLMPQTRSHNSPWG